MLDNSAQVTFQIPVYSSMLYCSGVPFHEGITALGVGLLVGAGLGNGFGYVQDAWRGLWGKKQSFSSLRKD